MTVSEHFFPFKELVSSPGDVRDCFGLIGFQNLVAWALVDKRKYWHYYLLQSPETMIHCQVM